MRGHAKEDMSRKVFPLRSRRAGSALAHTPVRPLPAGVRVCRAAWPQAPLSPCTALTPLAPGTWVGAGRRERHAEGSDAVPAPASRGAFRQPANAEPEQSLPTSMTVKNPKKMLCSQSGCTALSGFFRLWYFRAAHLGPRVREDDSIASFRRKRESRRPDSASRWARYALPTP